MPHDSTGTRPSSRIRACLILVVVLGALLRLYGLGSQSLWFDEAVSIHLSQYVTLDGAFFSPKHNIEPPMIAALTRLWLAVLHAIAPVPVTSERSDFLIRLLPCFFGVLAIPLVFLCGYALLRNERAALIASFLYAMSPFHIYYAQELRVYTLYIVLSLGALYFLLAALERGNWRYWAGLALCEAVLMYSHFNAAWTLLLVNVWLALRMWRRRAMTPRWILSQACAGVLMLPALWQLYTAYGIVKRIEIAWYPETTWKTGLITFKTFFAGYSPTVWAYWALFAMAAALFLLGLALMARYRRAALLIGLLAVVPILANVIMWKDRVFSFYEHRLFMFSGVATLFAIAYALETLRPRVLGMAMLALFAALTVPGLRDFYLHRLHPINTHRLGVYDKGDFRGAAAYIRDRWQAGDLVCHGNHFSMYSMRHYLDVPQVRLGTQDWEAPLLTKSHGNEALLYEHDIMPRRVETATKDANRLWFIESQGITFEYKPLTQPIRDWLDAHFDRIDEGTFHGLTVTLFARRKVEAAAAGSPPNVLFILADTLRADRLGATRNGVPITPRLDGIARASVVFRDTVANCSWTKPSLATVFTSLHVDAHQVYYSARDGDSDHATTDVLPDGFETLAELLARHGYDTFGVQTNANLTRANGFAQGFRDGHYVYTNGARADWVTGQALNAAPGLKQPFFLYVHYMDPHAPYEAPAAYRDLFGPPPALPESDHALLARFMDYYMDRALTACGVRQAPELGDLSSKGKEYVQRLYDAEVRFMDEQIGVLLDWLDRDFPNTVTIIASDHGEEFWEHEGMGHGTTLFEEQLRVPLLWRAPALAPVESSIRAQLIDILPTLASQLGFEQNPQWQGRNLFGDEAGAAVPRFSRTYGSWKKFGMDAEAVSSGSMKLIRDNRAGSVRLYDLAADSGEQSDAATAHPSGVESFSSLLEQHRSANAERAAGATPVHLELSPEEKERLSAIGYAGP